MKIKTTSGKTIDTDKLSDKEADITEAINDLYKLCHKYNVTLFCRTILGKDNYLGATNMAKASGKKSKDDLIFLLSLLAGFVIETTNGKYQFIKVEE